MSHIVQCRCVLCVFCQAVKMDITEGGDDEAVTSSMVDDVFFIIQKAVRSATYIYSTWNLRCDTPDEIWRLANYGSYCGCQRTNYIKQKKQKTGNNTTPNTFVKFINYSWGCKPIPAQYSDHMYTNVNPNTTPAQLISIH